MEHLWLFNMPERTLSFTLKGCCNDGFKLAGWDYTLSANEQMINSCVEQIMEFLEKENLVKREVI